MSRLWLYRAASEGPDGEPEYDQDGDPLDFGVVRAAKREVAVKKVRERFSKLDINTGFKIYPLKDRLTSGVLADWDGEKPSMHGPSDD